MNIELIKTLILEFHEKLSTFHLLIKRDIKFPDIANKILVAIGMRRTGKTHFVFQHIQSLLQKNVSQNHILYINFEDDRLYPLDAKKLGELIDSFYTLYPDNHNHLCYLFLDEIQIVENWAVTVRRLFDSKNVRIFLSGSSSKLLSTEIATSLRGRSLATEIWPFSFSEFLVAKQAKKIEGPAGRKTMDQLQKYFLDYLNQGGFPEVLNYDLPHRTDVLQEYVNVVILKDIIERHNITNIQLIRYLIKTILKNAGCTISITKLFRDLKSQGYAVGKMTLHDYLSYIEDAYLAFTVPLYSESIRKTNSNPKKIYAIDTGLVNAYNLDSNHNMGHLFENFIFLHLRRERHEIFYYLTENRHEVDFVSKSRDGKMHLYQVCWDSTDKATLDREMRALHEAEKELKIKGKLITPENFLTDFVDHL